MAVIQNSAIIQKLIDELELYPALDKVPTELAEKILPVFQVNTEEIIVKTPPSLVVRGISSAATAYTTPATGKFYLTGLSMSVGGGSASQNLTATATLTVDGSAQTFICKTQSGATTSGVSNSISHDFQNPILLDPATTIALSLSGTNAVGTLNIVGYTE